MTILFIDERGLVLDDLLDLLKKEVGSFLAFIFKPLNVLKKLVNILWRLDSKVELLALAYEQIQLGFQGFALPDLGCVGQVVGRLFLVQIKKLGVSEISEVVEDVPRLILWHC